METTVWLYFIFEIVMGCSSMQKRLGHTGIGNPSIVIFGQMGIDKYHYVIEVKISFPILTRWALQIGIHSIKSLVNLKICSEHFQTLILLPKKD